MKLKVLLLLLSIVFIGCENKVVNVEPEPEEIIYPVDIEITDCPLPSGCGWRYPLTAVDDSVYVIHSEEDLSPFVTCTSGEISIDFETYSLLYSTGGAPSFVIAVTSDLQQISDHEYSLNVDVTMDNTAMPGRWWVLVKVPKLLENAIVKLNLNLHR